MARFKELLAELQAEHDLELARVKLDMLSHADAEPKPEKPSLAVPMLPGFVRPPLSEEEGLRSPSACSDECPVTPPPESKDELPDDPRVSKVRVSVQFSLPHEVEQSSIKRLSQLAEDTAEGKRFSDLDVNKSRLREYIQMEQDTALACKIISTLSVYDPGRLMACCLRSWSDYTMQMRANIDFVLHERWLEDQKTMVSNKYRSSVISMHSIREEGKVHSTRESLVRGRLKKGRIDKYVILPTSHKRSTWEIIGFCLLLYDLVMIPLGAFGVSEGPAVTAMDWISLVFWTLDVPASCLTGYVVSGEVIMDPVRIMQKYLVTWFVLDAFIVVPDWVFLGMKHFGGVSEGSDFEGGKVLRGLRIVRSARILRLVKVARFMDRVKDAIQSEGTLVLLNVSKLMCGLLGISHLLSSLWYLIGYSAKQDGLPSWTDAFDYENDDVAYRYLTAMHWIMTQFTPASVDVQPRNSRERFFALWLLLLGLVIFSSFISSITQNMMQLAVLQDAHSKQMWILRKYLLQHRIDRDLFFRVLRYLEYHFHKSTTHIPEAKVTVLGILSKPLREELRYTVSFGCLKEHPLFDKMGMLTDIMHKLVSTALGEIYLALGDVGLECSSTANEMYCLESGTLTYTWAVRGTLDEDHQTEVQEGDWLCEPCIWTNWCHLGSARASEESKMVSIDAQKFTDIVKIHSVGMTLARAYATAYVAVLSATPRRDLSDIMRGWESRTQFLGFEESLREELQLDYHEASLQTARNSMASARRSMIAAVDGLIDKVRRSTFVNGHPRSEEQLSPSLSIVPEENSESDEDGEEEEVRDVKSDDAQSRELR